MYANLARLNLPYPEAVFDISFFRNNPLPFYTLAHELWPGNYRPTIAHCFVRLLWDKGLLLKAFTQNIDCLEREAGVPDELIVEAHGSFARQRCIECKTPYPDDLMKKAIDERDAPHCIRPQCNGLVKPDIVFFGEQLPETFFLNRTLPAAADLCIIMGTSLSVQPFASLPQFCSDGVPRLLINKEQVGGLGSRADDVILLGDCDEGVRKLAFALGWTEELEAIWKEVNPEQAKAKPAPEKSRDEALEDEIEKITKDVDQSLKLSRDHAAFVNGQLAHKPDEKSSKIEDYSSKKTSSDAESQGSSWESVEHSEKGEDEDPSRLEHVYPHIDPKSSL